MVSILFIGIGILEIIFFAFKIFEINHAEYAVGWGDWGRSFGTNLAMLTLIPAAFEIAIGGLFWWKKSVAGILGIVFCGFMLLNSIFHLVPLVLSSTVSFFGAGSSAEWLWRASLLICGLLILVGMSIEARYYK